MKGAGICSLYRGFHCIEVHYIKARVYVDLSRVYQNMTHHHESSPGHTHLNQELTDSGDCLITLCLGCFAQLLKFFIFKAHLGFYKSK